jgi:plastocyanin
MKRTIAFLGTVLAAGAVSAWAYEGGAVSDGGTISGQVKYTGAPPAPKPLEITKDKEVCAATPKMDESLVVGGGGELKNAVVTITNITKGKAMPSAATKLEQKGCVYIPRVTLIPAGQTLDITNDDGILHNIHTYSKKNPPVNRAQPKFKKVIQETFKEPETFEVRCDAHGWMQGWVVVQDHPYYALTDATGKFSLSDVPAGEYEVKVWHEKLGEKTQKVTVPAKGAATANFELAAK